MSVVVFRLVPRLLFHVVIIVLIICCCCNIIQPVSCHVTKAVVVDGTGNLMTSGDDANVGNLWIDSRVNVHIPAFLNVFDSYEHVKSEFGFKMDRGAIHAYVYYVNSSLCEGPISLSSMTDDHNEPAPPAPAPPTSSSLQEQNSNDDRNSFDMPAAEDVGYIASSSSEYHYYDIVQDHQHPQVYPHDVDDGTNIVKSPFILMVKSSHECSSVVKVRNGQAIGAAAVLIATENCRCNDTECLKKYAHADSCIDNPLRLVDDGSAGDVSIPSFLLYKGTAGPIIDQLTTNQPVLMQLSWGLGNPDILPIPQVDLWTTTHDLFLPDLALYGIKVVMKAFSSDQVQFTPHYSVLNGTRFHCGAADKDHLTCNNLCTNNGRYCAINAKNVSGAAILIETVRQSCIWQHYSSQDALHANEVGSSPNVYWDYVVFHRKHCMGPDGFGVEDCIHKALEYAQIPNVVLGTNNIIDDCMKNSGNLTDDVSNTILESYMVNQTASGVVQLPTILVNQRPIEKVSGYHLFRTICHYYMAYSNATTKNYPDICDTCGSCDNLLSCLDTGKCTAYDHHKEIDDEPAHASTAPAEKKKKGHRWFWTMFILSMIGGGYYYYTKYYSQGIRLPFGGRSSYDNDRPGLLNNYFQLNTNDN